MNLAYKFLYSWNEEAIDYKITLMLVGLVVLFKNPNDIDIDMATALKEVCILYQYHQNPNIRSRAKEGLRHVKAILRRKPSFMIAWCYIKNKRHLNSLYKKRGLEDI